MNLTPEELARFNAKYTVHSNSCWLWNGPLDRDGYGSFYLRRRTRRAHRVAWYSAYGEIPPGMVVNHFCRNRHCVNPQHLELVTWAENALNDSTAVSALNARKTHCPKNHPLDGSYVVKKTGRRQRYCRTCERAKKRRLRVRWIAEDTLRV